MIFSITLLGACENKNENFPSPIVDFAVEDFDEKFFNEFTLIIVPYQFGTVVEGIYLYTVYIDNGNLNFLFEFTTIRGDRARTSGEVIVILPNEILSKYEIGVVEQFYIISDNSCSSFNADSEGLLVRKDRNWLRDIRQNSVENKVANVIPSIDRWKMSGHRMTPIISLEQLMSILQD